MGLNQSKTSPSPPTEQSFYAPPSSSSISFSPILIDQLSSTSSSSPQPDPPLHRQELIDSQIREKISREISNLKSKEEEILKEISSALEKENIDKEIESGVTSSRILQKDLEVLRQKVERRKEERKRWEGPEWTEVKKLREEVGQCYK
jgi:MICOS complex subunit MIC19